MITEFKVKKKELTYARCHFCGPLICKAEEEGFAGHIGFYMISSVILVTIGLLFDFILIQYNIEIFRLADYYSMSISSLFYVFSLSIGGIPIFMEGIEAFLEYRRFKVDLLVLIASIGAIAIQNFLEAALVVDLFVLAEYLEDYAVDKAKKTLEGIKKFIPETVRIEENSKEKIISVNEVKVGDIVIVRPGERIPVDGTIIAGETNIDQSIITGESIPVFKDQSSEVYAGTIVLDGEIKIKVTKKPEETLVARMIQLVLEAEERKTKIERFIDKFSNYYVPTILVIALLTAIIPPFILREPFMTWIYRSLVLLVLSCPCALVISIPSGMVSGLTTAARNSVIIKGSDFLELLSEVKTVAFDKTGTITESKLEIVDVIPVNDSYSKEYILDLAITIERKSNHPIARAIYKEGLKFGAREIAEVTNFKEIPGRGLVGRINSQILFAGNEKLLEELNVTMDKNLKIIAERRSNEGNKIVYVGLKNIVIGLILLADKIREDSIKFIRGLNEEGIESVMLTGDNENVARAVAERLGIKKYYANLLPDQKVDIVRKLRSEKGPVAMIGDGINDAPALASADLGVAMGIRGIDVTIETADIVLMRDDLSVFVRLRKFSRKTLKIIKQNVFLAILIKMILIIFGILGLVTLIMAIAIGDDGLAILVAINSLRLLREKF